VTKYNSVDKHAMWRSRSQ